MITQDYRAIPQRGYPVHGIPLYGIPGGAAVVVVIPPTTVEGGGSFGTALPLSGETELQKRRREDEEITQVIIAFTLMEK